jgi:hypothetical protein
MAKRKTTKPSPSAKRVKRAAKKVQQHATREEGGPLSWVQPLLEAAYTRLVTAGSPEEAGVDSSLQAQGKVILGQIAAGAWRDVLLEYKRRKSAAIPKRAPSMAGMPAPAIPGVAQWTSLGPAVVLNGQTVGDQPVGGRVAGLAMGPAGNTIYAATANGGVFRSTDGATTWRSMMDEFDLDPTSFASTSLVCGAIAIDSADPNRVYVGTGEGDTFQLFTSRVTRALPAYRGVGVLRSDDRGDSWEAEPSAPDLAGHAFFGMAVDPGNRENVIAATTRGIYRREPAPGGTFSWRCILPGVFPSVVVTSAGGVTRFFCASWGRQANSVFSVFHSDDGGQTWSPSGTGLPTDQVGRIALGIQPNEPNRVYAFVAHDSNGGVHGLYRLDAMAGAWKPVANVPDVLPLYQGQSQGGYDLAIAVDPLDADIVYLGGSYANFDPYPGSVWRCHIQATNAGYKVHSTRSIGTYAHADIHVLMHTPGNPNELWCGCDGGIFLNRDPRGTGEFAGQNNGLACLCTNFIAQHPTDPSILFTGLQDNGTARKTAGSIWSRIQGGDGGYCLINWAKPTKVLVYMNGAVFRSTTGGLSADAWSSYKETAWSTMTQPVVSPPYNPAKPADAEVVALGDGQDVYLSSDFGASWQQEISIPGGSKAGNVYALALASPTRLFIGTTTGRVFQADRSAANWAVQRLDNKPAGRLGLEGLISDIAVDWADANRNAVYVAFGGMGDARRVWWFDGTKWEVRSGSGTNVLLDVEHNALAVDSNAPSNVYVGADIGVWHSSDGGRNWKPFQYGLPDAPVFDLQIHPTQRLLRAATHGRGLYEIPLP